MSTSAAQVSANQINARKSTGPITAIGKSKVANNAIKHGIFSKPVVLKDEDPLEYQGLLEQLQSELAPSGILEQALVERIALSLWRQKRLVRAEAAYIELSLQPQNMLAEVGEHLARTLYKADLTEVDPEHYAGCLAVVNEYAVVREDLTGISEESAPLLHQHVLSGTGSVEDLARYCRQQVRQAEQRPMILEVVGLVKSKRAIPKDKVRDSLAGYQVMLDNDLYKALKALREAQEWRFKTLTVIDGNGFVFGR